MAGAAPVDFDANATTQVSKEAIAAMGYWVNMGNPSAVNPGAAKCRELLDEYRDYAASAMRIVPAAKTRSPRAYQMVINAGASEGNSTIIRSAVEAYRYRRRQKPHLVVGAAEHKCVTLCVEHLVAIGQADVTWLAADEQGRYSPADARQACRSNTALLVVMAANNETGAINDVAAFGLVAAERQVPFHCDAAQAFGKIPFLPLEWGVSSFAVSAHKCHGPKGVGILGVRRDFVEGYELAPIVHGTQNDGLRGGTENVAGCAAALAGLRETFSSLAKKSDRLRRYRQLILHELAAKAPVISFPAWRRERAAGTTVKGRRFVVLTPGLSLPVIAHSKGKPSIQWGEATNSLALPNTLLIAVVDRGKKVCNIRMRQYLLDHGFAVSIGSACGTGDPKASHVIRAMGADDEIARGTLRITLPQAVRKEDCVALGRLLAVMPAA